LYVCVCVCVCKMLADMYTDASRGCTNAQLHRGRVCQSVGVGKIGTLRRVIVACADCMHTDVVWSAALLAACACKYCAENFLNNIIVFLITCNEEAAVLSVL